MEFEAVSYDSASSEGEFEAAPPSPTDTDPTARGSVALADATITLHKKPSTAAVKPTINKKPAASIKPTTKKAAKEAKSKKADDEYWKDRAMGPYREYIP
jgi:hypothetical protein